MALSLQNLLKKVKKELFLVVIVYNLLLSFFEVNAVNRTIVVGKNSYFTKISEAIENAKDGDTILVHEGMYEENLIINKRISLVAIGKVILIGAKAEEPVVTIAANNVQIEGFNITNTNGFFSIAVYIAKGYGLSRIYNNTIMNTYFGIFSDKTFENEITNNSIVKNNFGIMLNNTFGSEFKNNKIENNKYGLVLSGDSKNTIRENKIKNNQYGIYFFNSESDIANDNYLYNNAYGIYLTGFSNSIVIENNTVTNSQYGLFVDTSHFNDILGNKVESSTYGLYLQNCRYNNVSTNFIINETVGIQLYGTINNTILNNTVIGSTIGIEVDNSYNDTIKGNVLLNIFSHAITMYKTTGAKIIKNIINSAKNGIVFDSSSSNMIIRNRLNNVYIGVYLYSSDFNSIEDTTIEAREWYIKSQSEHYNYVRSMILNSERINFSFLGKVAIKKASVNATPEGYTYLNECIFVNITQGSFAYINFSYSNKPYGKVTILYTTDGKNWGTPTGAMKFFENIKVVTVKAESSGTYALFSYSEERGGEMLVLVTSSFFLFFVLFALALFFVIRKRKNEK